MERETYVGKGLKYGNLDSRSVEVEVFERDGYVGIRIEPGEGPGVAVFELEDVELVIGGLRQAVLLAKAKMPSDG